MARFHEANDQFHQARLRLDGVGEMNDEERRDIGSALRAAEREVEAATEQINQFLARDARPGGGDSSSASAPPPQGP
jgi:hypothetical protein